MNSKPTTIAVDLDGTLASYDGWNGAEHIGEPIKPMLRLVRLWTSEGKKVVIFTARAADKKNIPIVKEWLKKHNLGDLEVTNVKTPDIGEFYDDKAFHVVKNTGKVVRPFYTLFDY